MINIQLEVLIKCQRQKAINHRRITLSCHSKKGWNNTQKQHGSSIIHAYVSKCCPKMTALKKQAKSHIRLWKVWMKVQLGLWYNIYQLLWSQSTQKLLFYWALCTGRRCFQQIILAHIHWALVYTGHWCSFSIFPCGHSLLTQQPKCYHHPHFFRWRN